MDKIEELLTRGVDAIYPSKEELEKVLVSGRKLTLYQGFDPTGTDLHIGHMIGLRKLKQWQDLGHHVIFLIGDGTGQAGDPSGKLSAREKFFSREELRENAKAYVMQASKIMTFEGTNAVEIRYNGDWLNKLGLVDILEIAGHFTLQQLSERDMFQERMKKNEPVNLREFLYPLLQGYDSVAMEVDLEVGGSDQMFNMLCGRTLEKAMIGKEKFVMTTPLLTDSKGRKIGKTEGNVIGLTDEPADLFGKIMSLTDDVIIRGFEYLTDIPLEDISIMKQDLENGVNPIKLKKQLAYEIIKQVSSEDNAQRAQSSFESVFQKKQIPMDIQTDYLTSTYISSASLAEGTVALGLAESKSEAKRYAEQGAITINGNIIKNPAIPLSEVLNKESTNTFQVGKFKFKNVKIKDN